MLRYTVLLQQNQDVPGYWVMVPELPGCFSQGDTVEEALDHVREAIECHLEAMTQEREEIPTEADPFIVAMVEVQFPNGRNKAPDPIGLPQSSTVKYTVLLDRDQSKGGYSAVVPGLKACVESGSTKLKALANVRKAIERRTAGIPAAGSRVTIDMVQLRAGSLNSYSFKMARKLYHLTRKAVLDRAFADQHVGSEKLWYVRVKDRELPARWLMRQLMGLDTFGVGLDCSTKAFFNLGFGVIYKGDDEKEDVWRRVLGSA